MSGKKSLSAPSYRRDGQAPVKNTDTNIRKGALEQTDNQIFALDIGTRTVVGVLGHISEDVFVLDDAVSVPHRSRAMTDGQIEDISQVARIAGFVKNSLEERNNIHLTTVSIAAAGRALRTCRIQSDTDIEDKGHLTEDAVRSIEMDAVSSAQSSLNSDPESAGMVYYCVGHTVVRYFLDDYPIKSLLGHKGRKASAEIIAAFLPGSVVESLYSVTDMNGLSVRSLTLEPIAAMNVIIPPDVRLINIALVDIGAGTSDIAISRDGSIVAYAMATVAGDEITEDIIKKYLVDFSAAEEMKVCGTDPIKYVNILGMEQEISTADFYQSIFPTVDMLADTISKSILEANGEAPAAVFLVGGGSKLPDLTKIIAEKLGLPENRVVVGGQKFMKNVDAGNLSVSGPEYVTPIGIGVTATLGTGYDFSTVTLNGQKIRVFDTNKITVIDILGTAGYKPSEIIGRSGRSLTFMLNGERKLISGTLAEPAEVTLNGVPVSLDTPVKQGSVLVFSEAVNGENASCTITDIAGDVADHKVTVDGMEFYFGTTAYANGRHVGGEYKIQNYDDITISTMDTLGELSMALPFDCSNICFMKNGKRLRSDYYLNDGDEIITCDKSEAVEENANNIARQIAEKLESKEEIHGVPTPVGADIAPEELKEMAEAAAAAADDKDPGAPITVILNGHVTTLERRSSAHEFLELMALADIDTKNPPVGKDMILTLNGKSVGFMEPLKDGDEAVIRWAD